MDFISIFFITLSFLTIFYLLFSIKTNKRVHYLVELFYLIVFGSVLIIFIFPDLLVFFQDVLGLDSIINFIVYLSIFILFILTLNLYNVQNKQREEITKLVREIALRKKK